MNKFKFNRSVRDELRERNSTSDTVVKYRTFKKKGDCPAAKKYLDDKMFHKLYPQHILTIHVPWLEREPLETLLEKCPNVILYELSLIEMTNDNLFIIANLIDKTVDYYKTIIDQKYHLQLETMADRVINSPSKSKLQSYQKIRIFYDPVLLELMKSGCLDFDNYISELQFNSEVFKFCPAEDLKEYINLILNEYHGKYYKSIPPMKDLTSADKIEIFTRLVDLEFHEDILKAFSEECE